MNGKGSLYHHRTAIRNNRSTMIIRHDLRLVFLHIPKCAGKELRAVFSAGSQPEDMESYFNFAYSQKLKRHVDLAHLPIDDLIHFPAYHSLRNYTVIAAVRNPYQRLRSAIKEYCRQYSKEDERIANQSGPTMLSRSTYMREVPVRHGLRDPRFVHSMPMHWFTHYGQEPWVDHIVRCESLRKDVCKLAQKLNLPPEIEDLATKTLADQDPAGNTEEAITPEEVNLANTLYAVDFDVFGYSRLQAEGTNHGLIAETISALTPGERHSHSIGLLERAQRVEWHWGPVSEIPSHSKVAPTR